MRPVAFTPTPNHSRNRNCPVSRFGYGCAMCATHFGFGPVFGFGYGFGLRSGYRFSVSRIRCGSRQHCRCAIQNLRGKKRL